MDERSPWIAWHGPLAELWPVLRKEAWKKEGRWAARELRGGLVVLVRVQHVPRRQLQLERKETVPSWVEARVVLEAFHLQPGGSWKLTDRGPRALRFEEVLPGDTPEEACIDCGALVPADPSYTDQRCLPCAIRAGAAFTSTLREQGRLL